MSKISAEVIADSVCNGRRITTMKVVMPRMILAEFNTHRMFSRNSASSRAIPFKKMVEMVKETPFIPLKWMKEHSGMQGTEYFGEEERFAENGAAKRIIPFMKDKWLWARDMAVQAAEHLNDAGVFYHPDGDITKLTGKGRGLTKQLCNRLLEPFMYHTVLVTATEFENFFALRAHEAAEIHMQALANEMLTAYNDSVPRMLEPGEWHIPFGDGVLKKDQKWRDYNAMQAGLEDIEFLLKVATARCAQTSYTLLGDDDKPLDYAKLIALHDRLASAGHWSPFEHCARAMSANEMDQWLNGCMVWSNSDYANERLYMPWERHGWCKNFRGWIQYRALFPNENKTDGRVKKV